MYIYNLGILFKQISELNSDNPAIKNIDGTVYAYNYLDDLSNKIANFLIDRGIRKNDVISIFNEKSVVSYSIMIACLKIGSIYTNIDYNGPVERIKKMFDLCKPVLFFCTENSHQKLIDSDIDNNSIIEYTSDKFINILEDYSAGFPVRRFDVNGSDPAYIMFTSGSTGFPKGVVITHSNILNFIEWSKLTYQTSISDVFTNINPMHFDNSVFDFYSSLFTGAALLPVPENMMINPKKMIDAFNQIKPTIWFSVPSMLVYVLKMRALEERDLLSLRIISFGGEGFPKSQLRKLWAILGQRVQFINVYGPTECTCICSSYLVKEEDMSIDVLLPLGPMAPNFDFLILDDNNKPVADGETGELCIAGPNVGLGYYNNQEKTEEVFIQNPNVNFYRDLIYKSGDLVYYNNEKNQLHFCGRKDNQIKRMGYRIELEEIENAVGSLDYIEENAVVYQNSEDNNGKIIVFLQSSIKDENHISYDLIKLLPQYMLPNGYRFMENLPKNQNGKIDRLKLKEYL